MFRLGEATIDVGVSSVLDRPLRIEMLEIVDPFVRIDLGFGGSNIKKFLGNIERNTPASDEKPVDDDEAPLRIIVDRLVIRDAKVKIGSGVGEAGLPIPLATIELENIRGDDGQGVTAGELTGMIVTELVRRGAIDLNLDDLVPKEFARRMGSIAGSIGSASVEAVGTVGATGVKAAEAGAKAGAEAAGAVGDAVGGAVKDALGVFRKRDDK